MSSDVTNANGPFLNYFNSIIKTLKIRMNHWKKLFFVIILLKVRIKFWLFIYIYIYRSSSLWYILCFSCQRVWSLETFHWQSDEWGETPSSIRPYSINDMHSPFPWTSPSLSKWTPKSHTIFLLVKNICIFLFFYFL